MGGKERSLLGQIARFNAVGAVNTAFTYLVYSGLVAVGLDYRAALAAEYCVGVTFSFFANKSFTFGNREPVTPRMVARMIGSYAVLLVLNMVLLVLFVERAGLNRYVGQAAALVIVVSLSFAAQKLLVFRGHGREQGGSGDSHRPEDSVP